MIILGYDATRPPLGHRVQFVQLARRARGLPPRDLAVAAVRAVVELLGVVHLREFRAGGIIKSTVLPAQALRGFRWFSPSSTPFCGSFQDGLRRGVVARRGFPSRRLGAGAAARRRFRFARGRLGLLALAVC